MRFNRTTITVGLVSVGLTGALAAGGVAWASTTAPPSNGTTSSFVHCPMASTPHVMMTAAARYLGLSQTELRDRMHDGKSLAAIAEQQGKSVSGLKSAVLAEASKQLAANSSLTAQQRADRLALIREHLDAVINGTHPSGMDPDDMGGMMGNRGAMMGGRGNGMMGG